MQTTLNKIWKHGPSDDGWEKLLEYLGKTEPDDEPLSLEAILANDIRCAIWALRAVDGYDREIRLFACRCACLSLHIYEQNYPGDYRVRKSIETSALYAEALATKEDLSAAWGAAWDATRDAKSAPWGVRSAARYARAAALAAAWDAAWGAWTWDAADYVREEFVKMISAARRRSKF